jgi:hypothetical protein
MGKATSLGVAAAIAAAVATTGSERAACAQELRTLTLEPSAEQPQGPDPMLALTGAVIFAVPYGFGVFSAATTNTSSDKWLYVPIAGPWGDLISRLSCTTSFCKGDIGTAGLPLIMAGLGQAAGVGILIKSLISPPNRRVAKGVHFAPTTYAGGGGLTAYGAF